jgi:signal transduction histidine kinase
MSVIAMTNREHVVELTENERELGAIIAAYNDVTDRLKISHERLHAEVERLREELRLKNVELRRRERLAALGQMAAGLAHEVRNPLGGIALYASMLQQRLADRPSELTAATRISEAVRSLERLVCEILDFAQESRLNRHWFTLGEILHAIEDAAAPIILEKNAALIIDDSARTVRLMADHARMRQVLLNLVINGLQAVETGGRVWLSAITQPDGEVIIEVRDDGPGIPDSALDRIFNPFFTTKDTGTGLGLAIVHQIIEAHGGSIRVSNNPQGGANFVVRCPAQNDQNAKEEFTSTDFGRDNNG